MALSEQTEQTFKTLSHALVWRGTFNDVSSRLYLPPDDVMGTFELQTQTESFGEAAVSSLYLERQVAGGDTLKTLKAIKLFHRRHLLANTGTVSVAFKKVYDNGYESSAFTLMRPGSLQSGRVPARDEFSEVWPTLDPEAVVIVKHTSTQSEIVEPYHRATTTGREGSLYTDVSECPELLETVAALAAGQASFGS